MIAKWAKQFPKWAIAMTIFVGSTGLFVFWWYAKKPNLEKERQVINAPVEGIPPVQPVAPVIALTPVELDPERMLIGERSLYLVTESGIELVRENWLSEKLMPSDQVVFLKKENILVVGRSNHSISAFSTTGELIGILALSSGEKFDGYLSSDLSIAIFVKDGDMWRGTLEWNTAKIVNERQITNTGYFLGRPLQGRLLGATANAMLYRDARLGLIGVNLQTGAVESGQLPASSVPSPDGRIVIGDTSGSPPQLGVVDVDTLETKTFPISMRIPQNGLGWLDKTRAVITLGNREVQIYDHDSRSLETVYIPNDPRATVRLLAQPSPDGKFVMFEDSSRGVICLNVESKEVKAVQGPPMNAVEFLNDGAFLISSDVPDTELRGTWLGKFGDELATRIFAQPLVGKYESARMQQRFSNPMLGSMVVVQGFERWYLVNLIDGVTNEVPLSEKTLHPIQAERIH